MDTNTDALKIERRQALDKAKDIIDQAAAAGRELTEGEEALYKKLIASIDEADKRIQLEERGQRYASTGPVTRLQPSDGDSLGLSGREAKGYSLLRAVSALAANDWRAAGQEREASDALAARLGKTPRGFFVPPDVLRIEKPEYRDLLKGTGSAGGFLVDTVLEAGWFIDLLRKFSAIESAGALVLPNLVGDLTLPRQSGGATAYWVSEGANLTESQQAFEQVSMAAKSVGAFTDISRKVLLQATPEIEALVMRDLAASLATEVDRAALHGSGVGAEPLGLAGITGVNVVDHGVNGGAPTWAKVVEFETAVSTDNADRGALAYITNSAVRGKSEAVEKATNTGLFLWTDSAEPVNGYRAFVTNQVRSDLTDGSGTSLSAMFFGNWNDLVLARWGGLDIDILRDPYTGGISGALRIIAFSDVDIAVRHPESFARALDIITV